MPVPPRPDPARLRFAPAQGSAAAAAAVAARPRRAAAAAGRRAAPPDTLAAVRVFVLGTLLACLVLQRFALDLGDQKMAVATPIGLGLALWAVLTGRLAFDHRRVGLMLGLLGLALVATMVQVTAPVPFAPGFRFTSLANWLLVTGFAVFAFPAPVPEERFFRLVIGCLGLVAVAGLLQFVAQFAGLSLFTFTDFVPADFLLEENYAVAIPLAGTDLMRSNGFFLVEPSVFSQFMALAIMIEALWFRRPLWLAIFFAGLLASASGTGWLVFLVFLGQLTLALGALGLRITLGVAAGAVLALAVAAEVTPEIWDFLVGRIDEFTLVGTSGHERFVTPFMVLRDVLEAAPWAALTGIGPGTAEHLSVAYVYHVNTPVKILVEYGIPGLVLYVALFVSADRTPRQRALVLPSLVLLMLTGGYHQFSPVLFAVLLIITVARLQPEPGHHR